MNLQDYIKGNRKGADAHRIEKDSMKDPFMYDAIDGFDSINDDHIERINSIHKRLNRKTQATKKKEHHYHLWQISAASVAAVLIFAVGGYFYKSNYQTNLYSENIADQGVIKIYVPEEYYTENVVVIAKHNVEAVRAVNIYKYNAVEDDVEVVKAEDVLSGSDKVLDVYMPE
ncbi:hypothetical protein FACS1894179_08290 [Bacteroidia bacterium]|nr:hypothetical protein FACS1894179_08290 [Bacteroidia bacterium]